VKRNRGNAGVSAVRRHGSNTQALTAAVLLAIFPALMQAQAAGVPQVSPQAPAATGPAPAPAPAPDPAPAKPPAASDKSKPEKLPKNSDRRRAAKLFLDGSKLFEKEQFEAALADYKQAVDLDPTNRNYALAAEVARSHAVTALIQAAAKDRIRSDEVAERQALDRALVLDPRNIQVTEHLHELGDDAANQLASSIYQHTADAIAGPIPIDPKPGVHSFHLHTDQRHAIQDVFKAYGLDATVDVSVTNGQIRLDVDDADFSEAMRTIGLVTHSFYVPLDPHRVLVARDTKENRDQFERESEETIYLPGLTTSELNETTSLAKNVFGLQHATVDSGSGTITVRASGSTLVAFNATMREIVEGHNQVLLDVRIIQLAHSQERNTGVQPPQSVSAFNVYAEEQSILTTNQSLVQQIISSGLAAPGDTLAILGILLASGQVSSSLFSNGIALFGGGITSSALAPGAMTANLDLTSSDSKELDHILLRLTDGGGGESDSAAGTIKSGTRYPIQTSSFSGLSGSVPNIPGLTGAGTSSSLSSLLGSLGSSVPNVPQVEYQDLGLTLKATPRVMRNNDVALTLDMKIDALSGSSINGNPVLTSRAYSGVVTVRDGAGVVVASEVDAQESRAISGVPGLSEIPGMSNVTGNDVQKSSATLLIVISPHVVRGTPGVGHTPMMRVENSTAVR